MVVQVIVTNVGETRDTLVRNAAMLHPNERYKFINERLRYSAVQFGSQTALLQLRSSDEYQLFICELGDRLDQQNGRYNESIKFMNDVKHVTQKRDIPLLVIADRYTSSIPAIRTEIANNASLFIEKPQLRIERLEEMVRRGAEMGIDKQTMMFLRVYGFSQEFHIEARDAARRIANTSRLYFTQAHAKVPHKHHPYQVVFTEKHPNTKNPDEYWLDFIPENRHHYAAVCLDVRDWYLKHEDGNKARCELLLGGKDIKKK
jgi:hypothetical protein